MKLIYIANARIPTEKAHGYQIMKMCESFALYNTNQRMDANATNRITVELVVPKRGGSIKENPFEYYDVKKTFKIKKLFCLNLIQKPIIKHFGRLGLWLQIISFSLSSFFYLLFKKTDIIYSRDLNSIRFLSYFKKNICYEIHSMPGHFNFYKNTLGRISGIVSISESLKKILIKKGIDQEKILVARDGVDLDVFDIEINKEEARNKTGLPKDKKILGYTGSFKTMDKDKGISVILNSLKFFSQEDNIIFVAVGGSQKDIDYYYKEAESLGVADKIKLLRKTSLKELAVFQKSCDILLMPFPNIPHYAYYMSPLKMFEYMASKRPIIASSLPSIKEVLNNNNAILVDPDNPEELKNKIKELLNYSDLAVKISNKAYQDVKKYTWEKRAEKILINFYDSLG